jgi:hypothetical protein
MGLIEFATMMSQVLIYCLQMGKLRYHFLRITEGRDGADGLALPTASR